MLKILKLLSIISISAPLALVACSQSVETKTSVITIDRLKLEENFTKLSSNSVFDPSSIDKFINDFNKNPQNYFTSSQSIPEVTPFIIADINSFSENKIDETSSKINIKAELSPGILESFKTIKFTFELKSEYLPEVTIKESTTTTLEPLNNNIFSMDFRVLIPNINDSKEQRDQEIDWIKKFFAPDFIEYISSDIKKETLAKTATQIANEITSREAFEKIFKMKIDFPSEFVTGWKYEVTTKVKPNESGTVIFTFSLENALFEGENALTNEESIVDLELSGFKKE